MPPAPGSRVDAYELIRPLGSGGMGEVWLATELHLRRKVALKLLPTDLTRDRKRIARFQQEARAASALNHPNVCTIHALGETSDGQHYIAMEYVEGETLRARLVGERLPTREALDIAIQIASALTAAHAPGIVHRDIKPENVILRPDGFVKVLDFGLAKLTAPAKSDPAQPTQTAFRTGAGAVVGTVDYMSPEQARGQPVDARTDIWSLGVVLYEIVAGRCPFAGQSSSEVVAAILDREPAPLARFDPDVAQELQRTVGKALRKDRERRYQGMKDLLLDLQALRDDLAGQAWSSHAGTPLPGPKATAALSPTAALPDRSAAYDLYIRGRVKTGGENIDDINGAIALLESAVRLDPSFAGAYAQLARAYSTRSFKFASQDESRRLCENAEVALAKALDLEPNLAEVQFARGVVLWTKAKGFPHEQAIRAFQRALKLGPDADETHHQLSLVYSHVGLLDEAQRHVARAIDLNPNNTMARFRVSVYTTWQGRFEDALAVLKTVPADVSPFLVDRIKAEVYDQLGRPDKARSIVDNYLARHPTDEGGSMTGVRALLLAKAGETREARKTIARAIELGAGFGHFHHTAYNIAATYAALLEPDEAVNWVEATADDGFPCYPCFARDPNLDSLRGFPPFIDLMSHLQKQWRHFKRIPGA